MTAPADAAEIAVEAALVISMRGGARICVPPVLNEITPYVLLEQEDWFEDEIRFVRAWLKPGMHVVDVGANVGVYTLTAALRVGAAGQVWAVEPTARCAALLRRSLELNGCAQARVLETVISDLRGSVRFSVKALSETSAVAQNGDAAAVELPATTLDALAAELRWSAIDFIKLDVEGHELQAIRGGERLLEDNSPLVMIEVQASATFEYKALERLAAMGFAAYRLLPGPLVLVPFEVGEALDSYQVNLFACKPDRARRLAEEGLLAPSLPAEDLRLDSDAWQRYAASTPYAATFAARWPRKAGFFSTGSVKDYFEGLSAFAQSRAAGLDPARRWALLERALQAVEASVARDEPARPLRQLSFARLAWEFGRRDAAVRALHTAAALLEREAADPYQEPFLCPAPRFEGLTWSPDPAAWVRCATLEQLEKLREFSSIFVTDGTQHVIVEALAQLPQRSPEMDRRLQLVRLAAGRQAAPLATDLLCAHSEENLNPQFWCARPRVSEQ
jgi:FkbM family methyltransferase